MKEGSIWIDNSLVKLAEEVSSLGIKCSTYIVKQLLEEKGLGRRKMSRSTTIKDVGNRNEQFENIYELIEQYKSSGNPITSIDSKKKEFIGNFYREGSCYCDKAKCVFDHDFGTYSEGTIVPHGIYDLLKNQSYITLSKSKDTGEFVCDCIKNWWLELGIKLYPNATSILILCDGGGSNTSRGYLFKEDLQRLSNELGIEIRVAHFPPYTSKHNPIEHRVFCHLTRSLYGTLIDSIETVASKFENVTTSTGLKVFVRISEKTYEIGRKASDEFIKNCTVIFDDFLGKWNYRVVPQNQ